MCKLVGLVTAKIRNVRLRVCNFSFMKVFNFSVLSRCVVAGNEFKSDKRPISNVFSLQAGSREYLMLNWTCTLIKFHLCHTSGTNTDALNILKVHGRCVFKY